MEIVKFEPWMNEQVINLFVDEYDEQIDKLKLHLNYQYEHSFQLNRCVRMAAIEDGEVVGFTSFLYWPIIKNERENYQSFQCGNVIVSKNHRGKGVFSKILLELNSNPSYFTYDFIIGFPVVASFPGFIKKGWSNPQALVWLIKLNTTPRALLRLHQPKSSVALTEQEKVEVASFNSSPGTQLTVDFLDYREKIGRGSYLRKVLRRRNHDIHIEVKYQKRNKFIKEAIIGLYNTSDGKGLTTDDIMDIIRESNRFQTAVFFSVAVIPNQADQWKRAGFQVLKGREIPFIVKNGSKNFSQEFTELPLGRADFDTW